jgi:hypothetical protein
VVGFFNGIRVDLADTLKNPVLEMSPYKLWNDWEDKEELIVIPKGKNNSKSFLLMRCTALNYLFLPEPHAVRFFI